MTQTNAPTNLYETELYAHEIIGEPLILISPAGLHYVLSEYTSDHGSSHFEVHRFLTHEEAQRRVDYERGLLTHEEYFNTPEPAPYGLPDPTTTPHTLVLGFGLTDLEHTGKALSIRTQDETKYYSLRPSSLWRLKAALLDLGVPKEALSQTDVDLEEIMQWLMTPYAPTEVSNP